MRITEESGISNIYIYIYTYGVYICSGVESLSQLTPLYVYLGISVRCYQSCTLHPTQPTLIKTHNEPPLACHDHHYVLLLYYH